MSKLVRTTEVVVFFDFGCPPDEYRSYQVDPGFLCRLVDEGHDDGLLRPICHPDWSARVPKGCYEEVSPLFLLGEQAE
jgi:hypothetical protein